VFGPESVENQQKIRKTILSVVFFFRRPPTKSLLQKVAQGEVHVQFFGGPFLFPEKFDEQTITIFGFACDINEVNHLPKMAIRCTG